ncbi:MAG TPA: right-handed parallel beta-helix repeat-containing protein, partial [Ignavibacteria bacterium]|nr:right-handed parallel beta-helix repeat-containing protein [Ignavibacteria bacterium]
SAMILLVSDSNHIYLNNINNTGHDGINCIGYGNVIEKNVIANSILLLNDGGAIKSYGQNTANSVWNNNFAVNAPGNLEATLLKYNNIISSGIYLDDYCNNMKIVDNTIVKGGMAGIYLNNNIKNIIIKGNVCYDNPAGIYFLQYTDFMTGNFISGNTFFGINSSQISILSNSAKGIHSPGRFESNYYANPEVEDQFVFQTGQIKTGENFMRFKNQLGNNSDLNSKVITGGEIKYSKLFSNMTDDTSIVLLNTGRLYFDIELKSIYGSVKLLPYTSKIIISDKSMEDYGTLNIAGGPLKFGHVNEDGFRDLKWYKIYGENVNEKITVSAPEGFLISLSDYSGFSRSLTLYPASGSIEKIIFVRFEPEDDKGYFDFITNSSGNIVTKVKVSGNAR